MSLLLRCVLSPPRLRLEGDSRRHNVLMDEAAVLPAASSAQKIYLELTLSD
jgi:hypothetical protein